MQRFLFVCVFIFLAGSIYAQQSNLYSRFFRLTDTIQFDSLQSVNGSLIIRASDGIIPDKQYRVDHKKSILYFEQLPNTDSVHISWRRYPSVLYSSYYHKSKALLESNKPFPVLRKNNQRTELFQESDINRSGSISRGFTLGNNQDVTMNSSLNLQLSGKLTNELSVVASITDNNIPVQPDGNTQQLQEFDKIFIRVFNEKVNLVLGDYQLDKPAGTFLNVNKKLQGIQVTNKINLRDTNTVKITNTVSGAVAKGKYYRQQLQPVEGNQGPYKLNGANGERFIIIIAGSERVIIDGEEMKRGQQNDYIIDYNSAEVTFNPSVPISNDMRVYVEFEYTERNYTRFLVADYAEIKSGNTRIWMNVISESDSKNQPVDQDLDQEQIDVLASVGDNTGAAVVPNINEQEFDEDIILYARRDSMVDGQIYEVYYYSNNPDSAKYRLGFSLVGAQNGNYVQANNLANGKVYRWVAPENGTPQGNYAPVVKLAAPQSQQMVTTGLEVNHSKFSTSRIEVAWSRKDENTFSTLDQSDDHGLGVNYEGQHRLLGDSLKSFTLQSKYQFVHSNFNPFERFRRAEFERDWNTRDLQIRANQHLAGLAVQYKKQKVLDLALGANQYWVPGSFNGLKGDGNALWQNNFFNLKSQVSYLRAENDSLKSDFFRSKSALGVPFWKLEAGVRQELEINTFVNQQDVLNPASYEFFIYEAYLQNRKMEGVDAELTANYRIDHQALGGDMTPKKERRGISLNTDLHRNANVKWRLVANYREVRILNDSLVRVDIPDQHVSARIENRSTVWDGIIRSSTFYEVSTGLESKKEYAYLEVEKGQGNYIWIDRNENGVKELNEFEIAQIPAEADHIRMYIPTDDYISVYANQFKQNIHVNFRKWKVSENKWLQLLARFSNQFAFSVNRKVTNNKFSVYANPFNLQNNDTALVSNSQSLRNMFSFNKTNPRFGADLVVNQTVSKNLLTNGLEGRELQTLELQTRWNITQFLTLLNTASLSEKSKTADYFTANNYNIRNYKTDATFRIQPQVSYRFELKYKYDKKENTHGEERAVHHDGGVAFHYAKAGKNSIDAALHYIDVTFNGTGNNSLTYELLNGLQKGANYTWELNWNRQLSKSFQMTIRYNGRAGDDTKTIHIASMRVRAMF